MSWTAWRKMALINQGKETWWGVAQVSSSAQCYHQNNSDHLIGLIWA